MKLVEAIARMEGYYVEGTRPQRNNNPGDVEWGKFSQAHGATHGDPRFAIFPTAEEGFAALTSLLKSSGYNTLTVEEAINRYAPPVENNTTNYVADICEWVGCSPTTLVNTLV